MRWLLAALAFPGIAQAQTLTGAAAYGDWHADRPGVVRRILPTDTPPPYATRSSSNGPGVVDRPAGVVPQAPPGFSVTLFADGLDNPRTIRAAPNGDVFVAESNAGRIRLLRGTAKADRKEVFARDLPHPFGIAFYPPGPSPEWLYVANTNSVVRFPYRNGDTAARGPAQVVVPKLANTTSDHITRDVAFSPDGTRMYVSIGSGSNDAGGMPRQPPQPGWDAAHGLGAAWGTEAGRAQVQVFTPTGGPAQVFATGLRNCVGLAVQPDGTVWCSTNERDGLGDNLPADYVTRVVQGAFYGWPWYYLGAHEDPSHAGERPDLAAHVTVPDVLIQPHSAPLSMAFYTGASFPPGYAGDAFVALHGSWNRGKRTGYKIVRVHLRDGVPTGDYEDFLTGFVVNEDEVWGRPVGVTTAGDGALLVTEDANGTVWRVAR